jgi:hypothetical protein
LDEELLRHGSLRALQYNRNLGVPVTDAKSYVEFPVEVFGELNRTVIVKLNGEPGGDAAGCVLKRNDDDQYLGRRGLTEVIPSDAHREICRGTGPQHRPTAPGRFSP